MISWSFLKIKPYICNMCSRSCRDYWRIRYLWKLRSLIFQFWLGDLFRLCQRWRRGKAWSRKSSSCDWIAYPHQLYEAAKFSEAPHFHCHFIRNYNAIAAPLTRLGSTYRWSSEAKLAFLKLKWLFTSAPVLIQLDLSSQLIVEVNASDIGVEAVLSERSGSPLTCIPVFFFYRWFTAAERNYGVGNMELLTIKPTLDKWRTWLEGDWATICCLDWS